MLIIQIALGIVISVIILAVLPIILSTILAFFMSILVFVAEFFTDILAKIIDNIDAIIGLSAICIVCSLIYLMLFQFQVFLCIALFSILLALPYMVNRKSNKKA